MSEYSATIERRLKFVGVIVIVVAAVLLWRMFEIQIVKHDHYLTLAEGQQRFEKEEIAQRGKIYVHDSFFDPQSYYPLAFDIKQFAIWVVPRHITRKEETAELLGDLLDIPKEKLFKKIDNDKLYIPPVKRGLTLDEANYIKEQKIVGVFVMPEYARYYPEINLASHILGFVNAEGDGKYGFEGRYNNELKGTSGNVKGEKDTLGRIINLLEQVNPDDGTSYVLTIDRSVQYYVEKKLAEALEQYQADSGTVIIMDVKTGGIISIASLPSFDPNNFRDFAKDTPEVFVNPAIAHLYEPGSVFKPIVMSAALDTGAVTLETEEEFGMNVWVGEYEIKTAEEKAYGRENMSQVLQNSDNVAMVWVSEQLGKENLYKYIKNYGFFDKTGIDLDTEVAGYAPPFKHWRDINRATIAFGQGISITPIELVSAYAAMANKGVYVYPRVVDKIIFSDGSEKKVERQLGERIIKEDTAEKITDMLVSVVSKGHGKKAGVVGYKVAGKTGTAQIPKPEGGYEENEDNLGVFIHSFAGFAPAEDPRYAMIVRLDRPKTKEFSASTAAPFFGDISNFLLNYYYRLSPTE